MIRRQTIPPSARCLASGLDLWHRAIGVGYAEEVEEEWQVIGELGVEQQRPAGDFLAGQPLGIAIADSEVRAQHLQDRHQRDGSTVRLRLSLEDLELAFATALRELVGEAALADPRLGDDRDHRALARLGAAQRLFEFRHLAVAPDKAREAALAREVEPRAGGADPGQLEDLERPARSLDLELAQILQFKETCRKRGGLLGQISTPRLGKRLHPLSKADRVPDCGVLARAASADCAGDDLARVDPDPGREVEAGAAAQLGRVLGDVVEHLQSRVTGAPRVILVGDRGAEDGHDPVTGELVDGSLKALHRVGQDREEALHDLAPLLRVLPLGEVHRAAHVGEEHRYLLALAVVLAKLGHRGTRLRPV